MIIFLLNKIYYFKSDVFIKKKIKDEIIKK